MKKIWQKLPKRAKQAIIASLIIALGFAINSQIITDYRLCKKIILQQNQDSSKIYIISDWEDIEGDKKIIKINFERFSPYRKAREINIACTFEKGELSSVLYDYQPLSLEAIKKIGVH